jgi:hypothetical protein
MLIQKVGTQKQRNQTSIFHLELEVLTQTPFNFDIFLWQSEVHWHFLHYEVQLRMHFQTLSRFPPRANQYR